MTAFLDSAKITKWWEDLTAAQVFGYYLLLLLIFQIFLSLWAKVWYVLGRRQWLWFRQWQFPTTLVDLGTVNKEEALRYDTTATAFEICKRIFMTVSGLVLFRFAIFLIGFFLASVALFCVDLCDAKWWKTICLFLMRAFLNLHLFGGGYYVVQQHGTFASPSDVKIICSNHLGFMEMMVVQVLNGPTSVVTKQSNLANSYLIAIGKRLQVIAVDRSSPDSRRDTLNKLVDRAKNRDPNVKHLMIFPEGTCGNQICLFKFFKGAFVAGEPVQPICVRFDYRNFNPAFTAREFGGNNIFDVIYLSLCQFVNVVHVKCLDIYYPSEEEKANPDLYTSNVERLIAMNLGVPRSDATFQFYRDSLAECKRTGRKLAFPPRTQITHATQTAHGYNRLQADDHDQDHP
eukprot:c12711_g9_i1.p1 GENE.c12711_g9_i1~~c12711_g9_i1.p1  ORF type:complete len:402 (+),score=79.15 c12711_g9_i1:68-1273(+)